MDTAETIQLLSRDEILHRYRRWRQLRTKIHSAALKNVSQSAFLKGAKRIGLATGNTLIANSESEVTLAFDLALYSAEAGKTRAIDRYARRRSEEGDVDETLVLEALRASRFSLFRVIGKHEFAGLLLTDLLRGGERWLLDEGAEQRVRPGELLAMRVAPIEGFVITCGALVAFDQKTAGDMELLLTGEDGLAMRAKLTNDRRFPEHVYTIAVERELMSHIEYQ